MLSILHKDAAVLSVADAAAKGATAITAILIARFYGPELYGQYAIATAVAGLFMIFAGVGFEREFTRLGSSDPDSRAVGFRLTIIALLGACLLVYTGLAIFLIASNYSAETKFLTFLLAIVLILARFSQPFRYLCILLGRIEVIALAQALSTALLVGGVLASIAFGASIVFIVCLQLAVGASLLLALILWLPAAFSSLALPKASDFLGFVKRSIPFAISNVVWVAYFNFDTLLLSMFHGENIVGEYAGAFRLISISFIFGAALTHAFSPTLFSTFYHNANRFSAVARNIVFTQLLGGATLAVMFYAAADVIVEWILGAKYMGSVELVKGLSVVVLLRFVNFGLSELLTTSNQQRVRVILEMTLLAVNIALNILLVPKWGGLGAVFSSIAAEAMLLCGAIYFCSRENLLFRTSIRRSGGD